MKHILIVDDHAIIRRGLKQILEESCDECVLTEADSGIDALRKIRTSSFNVVLLDISMPGMSGIDVLKQIHAERPALPVLILSNHPEDQYAVRLIKAGAAGYLTKETAPVKIVEAIHHVAGGKKYISSSVAELLAEQLGSINKKLPHETLSDREYQIMILLAAAQTVSMISETLGLSVKTVSTYRSRILEKMHLQNNAELMRYVIENQLV